MLLIDLNTHLNFDTTPKIERTIEDKSKFSLDTELTRRDSSAKIQINAMAPFTAYGPGTYMMSSVKRMKATKEFLGMDEDVRYCKEETYEECRTRNLIENCQCVPWELHQQHIKVKFGRMFLNSI